MSSARPAAAALYDRAERHVFARVPELTAVQRRGLAMLDLGAADRALVARELGLPEAELAPAIAAARRALRRTLAPLAGGARCERAELLVSERLDRALDRHERKWLEIHLARCGRCEEHVALLDEARADLRASFGVAPLALPAGPEVAAPDRGSEGKARLRVVPPAVPVPPDAAPVVRSEPLPVVERPGARLTPAQLRTAKIVAILVAICALLAGLGLGIDALSGR